MTIKHTVNTAKPYAILMKGRADEPASHTSIAVYSKQEHAEYVGKGWKTAKTFMEMVNRAQRKDH